MSGSGKRFCLEDLPDSLGERVERSPVAIAATRRRIKSGLQNIEGVYQARVKHIRSLLTVVDDEDDDRVLAELLSTLPKLVSVELGMKVELLVSDAGSLAGLVAEQRVFEDLLDPRDLPEQRNNGEV